MEKHPLIKEILYTNKQIQTEAKKIAKVIDKHYEKQKVQENTILIIGLLKGCVPFLAEFLKNLTYESETDYMVVSSYNGGLETSGESKIILDVDTTLKDRHILIVEDVIDSGITLEYIKTYLYNRGAKDVKILTMIDKKSNRQKEVKPDWTCFNLHENVFLIGFGLDYQERLRNLPYVGVADLERLKVWKW